MQLKLKGIRATSFSRMLCVKQLVMHKLAHHTSVWALSRCQPGASCSGILCVNTSLYPSPLPRFFPLQPLAVKHITAAAFAAIPHHLSIRSQGLLCLAIHRDMYHFPWCLSCWNHDYTPLKNVSFSAFVTAENCLNTEILKV